MDTKKNLLKLIEDLKSENEMLKQHINSLNEELEIFQNKFGDNWLRAKEYVDTIKDAKEAEKGYKEAERKLLLIEIEYKKKLEKMMEQYKFKE